MKCTLIAIHLLSLLCELTAALVSYPENYPLPTVCTPVAYGCLLPNDASFSNSEAAKNSICYLYMNTRRLKVQGEYVDRLFTDVDGSSVRVLHFDGFPTEPSVTNATEAQCERLFKDFDAGFDYCAFRMRYRTGDITEDDNRILHEVIERFMVDRPFLADQTTFNNGKNSLN